MPMIDVADTRLHYWERGEGPVALFVHGFPLDATMWFDQMALLFGVRRCIAIDLRGFGRSDPVRDEVLTMERHADDIAALLDGLAVDVVDLVGLSMGGYVALAFAQLHARRVRTLALVDTRSDADGAEARAGRDEAARRLLSHGRRDLAHRMEGALLAPGASASVRGRIRTMIEDIRYETVLGALEGMKVRPDRTGFLGRIAVPVAVITGEHDAITPPAAARAMAAAISGATYTEIPGAGHMAPMEAPGAVANALRSLFAEH